MLQLIEVKIKKISPFCWGAFALFGGDGVPGGFTVYSCSSDHFPTEDEIRQITSNGQRLPPVVAAHYFPNTTRTQTSVVTSKLIAA